MENTAPATAGRMTRSRAKQVDGGITPAAAAPATATKQGARQPIAFPTLFKDVTNQLVAKAEPRPVVEEAKKPQTPLPEPKQTEEAVPEPHTAEKNAEPEPAATPALKPVNLTAHCATASKAEPKANAASKTPRTTVKRGTATPALKKPEEPAPKTPVSAARPASRSLTKQVSISSPKDPKSASFARPVVRTPFRKADADALAQEEAEDAAEEAALEAEAAAAAGEEPMLQTESSNEGVAGSQAPSEGLFGTFYDEEGVNLKGDEFTQEAEVEVQADVGSPCEEGLQQKEEIDELDGSPLPLTMSPESPAVWSCHEASLAGDASVQPSPAAFTMNATPMAPSEAGNTSIAPSPAAFSFAAGATPVAGKETVMPSPSVWSMGNTATPGYLNETPMAMPAPANMRGATPTAIKALKEWENGTPLLINNPNTGVATPNTGVATTPGFISGWENGTPMTGGYTSMWDDETTMGMETEMPGSEFSTHTCARTLTSMKPAFVCDHEEDEQMLPQAMALLNEEAAAPASEASKPKLKSVVVASAAYDPRSLSQLRREVKEASLKKKAVSSTEASAQAAQNLTDVRTTPLVSKSYYNNDEEDETCEETEEVWGEEEDDVATGASDQLVAAMGGLGIETKPAALKGVPLPQGTHMRFDDAGEAEHSPTSGKPQLRGLPRATGTHIRFD